MSEERKYNVIGKFEIGTDEYRDLIEDVKKYQNESNDNMRRYWSEQTKANDYKKELDKIKKINETLNDFIQSRELSNDYKMFLFERTVENKEDVDE